MLKQLLLCAAISFGLAAAYQFGYKHGFSWGFRCGEYTEQVAPSPRPLPNTHAKSDFDLWI